MQLLHGWIVSCDGSSLMMSDEIIPYSFRSTVQQLVSDCDRQASSAASSGIVSGLLNRVELTFSIIEVGFNLLSASPLFSAKCTLLSTFWSSLARCVRTLQYGQNDCTVPPVFIPSYTLSYSGYRGRLSILLNLEKVELLRSSGYTWNEIAMSLNSCRTVDLNECGITVEPLYYGHFETRYFWPFLLQYRGFSLSEVKNVLVTPFGTKIFVLIMEVFSIESLIWRVC